MSTARVREYCSSKEGSTPDSRLADAVTRRVVASCWGWSPLGGCGSPTHLDPYSTLRLHAWNRAAAAPARASLTLRPKPPPTQGISKPPPAQGKSAPPSGKEAPLGKEGAAAKGKAAKGKPPPEAAQAGGA